MSFVTPAYFLFFCLVFALYWKLFASSFKMQNVLLLFASYFFYACWDFRFTALLAISTLLNFGAGALMQSSEHEFKRRSLMWFTVVINLIILGFFKYYNFFLDNFFALFGEQNRSSSFNLINIILPVGISFYTFHGLSYILDIYYKRISPEPDLVVYGLFVCYFPLLVAGPIERATHLLPQLRFKRNFSEQSARNGIRQVLWGLFKKIVVADNCAALLDPVFANHEAYGSLSLFLAAILFSVQIYADFSGYCDIALGCSRMLGIELLQNFAFPYFSRDIAEFWRRWHISLTTWFRDYVYIPMGGSRSNLLKSIRNTFIVFLLSGLWHGANWTFVVWGLINAMLFIPLLVTQKNRKNLNIVAADRLIPGPAEILQITLNFLLVTLAWIFFRSKDLHSAAAFISGLFSFRSGADSVLNAGLVPFFILIMFLIEWLGRNGTHALETLPVSLGKKQRWALYFFLVFIIFEFPAPTQTFIYFQF